MLLSLFILGNSFATDTGAKHRSAFRPSPLPAHPVSPLACGVRKSLKWIQALAAHLTWPSNSSSAACMVPGFCTYTLSRCTFGHICQTRAGSAGSLHRPLGSWGQGQGRRVQRTTAVPRLGTARSPMSLNFCEGGAKPRFRLATVLYSA